MCHTVIKLTSYIIIIFSILFSLIPYSFADFEFNGNFSYKAGAYTSQVPAQNQFFHEFFLEPKISITSEKTSLHSTLWIRENTADSGRRIPQIFRQDLDWINEWYLLHENSIFEFRGGKQIFDWSFVDGIKPLDILNPKDFTEFINPKSLGVYSLSGSVFLKDFSLGFAVIPAFRSSQFNNDTHSRWFPFDRERSVSSTAQAGSALLPIEYHLKTQIPETTEFAPQYALRVKHTLSWIDWGLFAYHGYDTLPTTITFIPVLNNNSNTVQTSVPIELDLEYHPITATGFGFSESLGQVGVRGEASYTVTEDTKGISDTVDDPYVKYALGFDVSIGSIFSDHTLYLLCEFFQDLEIPNKGNHNTSEQRFNHLFQTMILSKIEYTVSERLQFFVEPKWGLKYHEFLLRSSITYSTSSGIKGILEFNTLNADPDSVLSHFRETSNIIFQLNYTY